MSRSRRHDEYRDVFLQGEVARVQELPELTTARGGENGRPIFTEDESDDLEEKLRDVESLRTEVEDLHAARKVRDDHVLERDASSLDQEQRRSKSTRFRGSTFERYERSCRDHLRGTCIE